MEISNAYVHMAYKLVNPSKGISQLGLMDNNTLYSRFMHGMYTKEDVENAAHICARDGLLDCVWLVEGEYIFVEEDFNSFKTLGHLKDGTLFKEWSGEKYDVSKVKMLWAVPQSTLRHIPERNVITLFDRMKQWLNPFARKKKKKEQGSSGR